MGAFSYTDAQQLLSNRTNILVIFLIMCNLYLLSWTFSPRKELEIGSEVLPSPPPPSVSTGRFRQIRTSYILSNSTAVEVDNSVCDVAYSKLSQFEYFGDSLSPPKVWEDLEGSIILGTAGYVTRAAPIEEFASRIHAYSPDYYSKYMVNVGGATMATFKYDPTHGLIALGYNGLLIDANDAALKVIENEFTALDLLKRFTFHYGKVNPPNIAALFNTYSVPKNLAVLKMDIDTYDCVVIKEVLHSGYSPAIIHMEINPIVPPPLKFTQQYSPDAYPLASPMYGCSLAYASNMLSLHNYTLVQLKWWDAIYVKASFAGLFMNLPQGDCAHYHVGFLREKALHSNIFEPNPKLCYPGMTEWMKQDPWSRYLEVDKVMNKERQRIETTIGGVWPYTLEV